MKHNPILPDHQVLEMPIPDSQNVGGNALPSTRVDIVRQNPGVIVVLLLLFGIALPMLLEVLSDRFVRLHNLLDSVTFWYKLVDTVIFCQRNQVVNGKLEVLLDFFEHRVHDAEEL